jgi:hypothetical protein
LRITLLHVYLFSVVFNNIVCPKKYVHTLDAHNSHINRDRIIVFCSDVLE